MKDIIDMIFDDIYKLEVRSMDIDKFKRFALLLINYLEIDEKAEKKEELREILLLKMKSVF